MAARSIAYNWLVNRRRFLLRAAAFLSARPYRAWATPVTSGWCRLRLIDAHSGATFDATYRDANGPIARVMDELYVFLRDQHSGRMTNIDVGVIELLANLMAAPGQTSAVVLSAFRSAETNAMLASTTLRIAETVPAFRLHPSRHRAGAQLGPR